MPVSNPTDGIEKRLVQSNRQTLVLTNALTANLKKSAESPLVCAFGRSAPDLSKVHVSSCDKINKLQTQRIDLGRVYESLAEYAQSIGYYTVAEHCYKQSFS